MNIYEHSIGLPSLEAIRSCFTDIAWARGGREYRADHLSIREGRWQGGQEGRVWVYDSMGSVAGFALQPGSWKVLTSCSCKEAFCAHAARVFHEAVADEPRMFDRYNFGLAFRLGAESRNAPVAPETQLEAWLKAQSRTEAGSQDENQLIFVLSSESTRTSGLRVHVHAGLTRKIKGPDAFAKIRMMAGRDGGSMRNELLSDDLYRMYYAWGRGNLEGTHTGWSTLVNDSIGVSVIKMAVEQGRLFCQTDDGRPTNAVRWAETRALEWDWELNEESKVWSVKSRVDGGGAAHFGKFPMFIDREALVIGDLDLRGMDAAAAEQATSSSPPIPDAWIKSNARSAVAVKYLPPVPENVVPPVDRLIQGVAPVPILRIDFSPGGRDANFDLSFRYDEERGFWAEPSEAVQFIKHEDGKLIELWRRPELERAHVQVALAGGIVFEPKTATWELVGADVQRGEAFSRLLADDFKTFRDAGFEIEKLSGWTDRVAEVEEVDLGWGGLDTDGDAASVLEFSIGFMLNGKRVNLLPMLPALIAKIKVVFTEDGQAKAEGDDRVWVQDSAGLWLGLPAGQLAPWLAALADLVGDRTGKDLRAPSLRVSTIEALRVESSLNPNLVGKGGLKILSDLMHAKVCEDEVTVAGFVGTLRPYQRSGFHWLQVMAKYRLGGVLGDDMGLGKTVQTIAHLLEQKNSGELCLPVLIVSPTSVLGNWRSEFEKFAPGMKVVALKGANRSEHFSGLSEADVVLSTYPLLCRDTEELQKQEWHAVFLDETQTIKNARTQAALIVRDLKAKYRVAMTGTLVENRLLDLWSIFDAVLPGYLSIQSRFMELFAKPIEKESDAGKHRLLLRRIAPFMLRRTKNEVVLDLPPKVETTVTVELGEAQAKLYEIVRLSTVKSVQEAFAKQGMQVNPGFVLEKLTRLRQVCCEPGLTEIGRKKNLRGSAKLEWLFENLPQMLSEGRKVLLFSTFTSFFPYIEVWLHQRKIKYARLTGETVKREEEIAKFRSGVADVFLIGLKSGGTGLNLVEADTVIHLDQWWNPKAEDQATDRAHRIGQTRTVFSMKLVSSGTIEERILQIQARKRRMFSSIVDGAALVKAENMTEAEIMWLLKPLGEVEDLEEVAEAA